MAATGVCTVHQPLVGIAVHCNTAPALLPLPFVLRVSRYLRVEENCQLDQKADVSPVDEDRNYRRKEILIYRNRINDLEKELQRTFRYYQEEIASVQKETHSNWLAACIAERSLNDLKQENKRKMYLRVEENCQLDQKADVSPVDEDRNYRRKEILIYRKRVEDLEQELDRTIRNSQRLILSYEKEAHINWWDAYTADRNLNDLKKEMTSDMPILSDGELETLQKDSYVLEIPALKG
ncbi:melanoma inhibitory activity protein 2-like [Ochotona curzoniae]|uniref:melanoma inhibitory activity protein 2-like n=1 Tax=Ochotona curzoniae TaxID=130825 RepID=UPI001B353C07|nr:melanoma inhibitory activity protein 2-like [Ochotona curzoniae]